MIAGLIASLCIAALLIALLGALRALWDDQYRDAAQDSYHRKAWLPMLALLVAFGAALSVYGWRAIKTHAPNDHPALEVVAACEEGVWSFVARGREAPKARDLRLRGGRDVRLTLNAGRHDTEFFVPGLGIKRRLQAGESTQLEFRPPAPAQSDEAALYRSVCLHHCRGDQAVRPFLVVVEAPRGILAF